MTRYDPLKEYLSASGRIMITLTFDEINAIIAPAQLPATAYQKTQWWENGLTTPGRHCSSWLGAGYRTVDITRNRQKQQMTFVKVKDGNN